jgi:hypothetical protein
MNPSNPTARRSNNQGGRTARVVSPGSFAAAQPTKAGGRRPYSPPSLVDRTMSESELQDVVLELLDVLGWRAVHVRPARTNAGWRTPLQGPTACGFPDVLAVCRDRMIAAELKSARGALTVDQKRWLDDLGRAGAEVYVWRPSDWTSGAIERTLRGTQHGRAS